VAFSLIGLIPVWLIAQPFLSPYAQRRIVFDMLDNPGTTSGQAYLIWRVKNILWQALWFLIPFAPSLVLIASTFLFLIVLERIVFYVFVVLISILGIIILIL